MNQGKHIFTQLTEFSTRRTFDRIVKKYQATKNLLQLLHQTIWFLICYSLRN